ncbi:MAG: hypothetical protein WD557_16035 [Dehalococcoidia bacterium]
MNARYPARPSGMWGHVNRTHVVAALAATLGVMVGAVGAAAWDVADDNGDANVIYRPPAINIDRLAESAAIADAPVFSGTSGADAISAQGRGFVDVASLEAAIVGQDPVTVGSGADAISAAGRGFVDVESLEIAIAGQDPVTVGSGASGGDAISAAGRGFVDAGSVEDVIAQHEAAIAGAGIVDDTDGGGRGQVFPE